MNKKRIMHLIELYAYHITKHNHDSSDDIHSEIEADLDAINDVAEHYRREACKLADMYNELASQSVDVTNPTGRHE